jgi:predicted DNA-binding transcriptional regulator AlpA
MTTPTALPETGSVRFPQPVGNRSKTTALPETGFVRLPQIIGNSKTNTPAIIPVCKATWWAGVKSGRFPKGIKLSPRVTVWRIADLRELIANGVTA